MKRFINVLVIGNGFDIDLGLKTKYSDFLNSEEFYSCIGNMKTKLGQYLKNAHETERWIDLEQQLKQFVCQEKSLKSDKFKRDFKILKEGLQLYLDKAQKTSLNDESLAYQLINKIKDEKTLIINFNYTDTVERLLNSFGSNSNIIHHQIHGSLASGDIVVGVEDEAKLPEDYKFLIKGLNGYKGDSHFQESFIKCNNLIIFGHSLGITDSSFFYDVFSLSDSNSSKSRAHRKVSIFYYGEDGNDNLNDRLMFFMGRNFRIITGGKYEKVDVENNTILPNDILYHRKGIRGLQYL